MPVFTVTGDVDPFLHVSMRQGETIYCESDAMVMMESTLDLKGKMKGGLGSALMRTFANGESFFQQHIEATRGDGDCLLSPTLPGAMQIVDVGQNQYIISDGAFVAASLIMLASMKWHVPELVTGGVGVAFILASLWSSLQYKKKHAALEA